MRGRFRRRLIPVCGVVDGSAAICSSSAADSLLKSVAGVLLVTFSTSAGLLISTDCSADGADAFESGDNRERGESN